jgi:hypothetical protein
MDVVPPKRIVVVVEYYAFTDIKDHASLGKRRCLNFVDRTTIVT